MAKNILAAQVNTSIMEGTESTFSVDVKDYLGESVDISLITLRCSLSNGTACEIAWNAELGMHELTIPALTEGSYEYEIDELLDTGETVALVTGVIGVFNRDSWQEPVLSTTSPNRTLRIVKADEKGQIEATWLATSAAAGYAYESKKNADVLRDAMPLILQAAEFMKSFDEALRQAIKVVNNYLWIGGVNTGHYLRGEDGKIPRYGADGYWYLGDERVGKARGDDGITPHITSTGYWAIGDLVTNERAVGRDGLDGRAMKRIRINSLDELPEQEERGVYYYLKTDNGWDKYVWLHPDGWVCVGEVNDIATSEIYGLMKYATDVQVDNGAPVGTNAEGQASVPLAGLAVAGSGKLGTSTVLTEGGMVGMNASGNMMVPVAATNAFGAVKVSDSATMSTGGVIGLDSNKQLRARPATLNTWGVVKLGSAYEQSNPQPYLVGIGSTSDGALANNYAFGGALQHRRPASWQGTMSWLDAQISGHPEYFGDMFYSGLLTTEQFSQSSGSGLELLPATTQRLAGVYLASSMTDSRAAAVLTSDVVVNYLNEHYYEKSVVYTKQETLTQIEYKLQPYATVSWVSDNYMTRSQIMAELEKKLGCPSGRVKNIEFLTATEREKLPSVDKKTAYLVYAG